MRITNTNASPRYFSYVGRTLQPGEQSPDLPMSLLFDKAPWADHDANHSAIRLSEADKTMLKRIEAANERAIKVQKLPPAKPALKRKTAPQAPAKPNVPMNPPGTPQGVPDFSRPLTMPVLPGQPSLYDLKAQNAARKQQALRDAQTILGGRV